MKEKSRWEKCRVKCPEDHVESDLLLEWHEEKGKKILTGVNCSNPKLMDLKPEDCQWSCWDAIENQKQN